ncbi:BppU family phage baseplate upper protein [Leuconostoc gasicomitatum]|uniref:BppU family phage baseplate upper protein n=1 Tax=Leuconostoc gasicomitatum TaxID=115778 RepID=UPI001CC5C975|nr:BppU family phage baseplate upper protein [Leuconostoc gasicomitatum]MBZ5971579.1 BppU family phage baseplate upper protein [Leuconostoc gasicomitatum]
MSNQYLSFDVTKQSAPQQLITGRQGDSRLKFVTMLFWDGDKNVPYDLTGKQVAFEALKPDNTHIVDYEGITILDAPAGLVRYSFNEQVFSVAGTMQQAFFKITHTDSDNNVIADSTLEVAINILENRVEFGINSKDYLSTYDDLIAQVKKKFDDYAATVQDSINKAQEVHDQIVEYTNLINSGAVILKKDFGNIEEIRQLIGNNFIEKLNNEFNQRGTNVKWYGAKGDGATDDTQAFIKAFSEGGAKKIFVPQGTYLISDKITVTKDVEFDNATIVGKNNAIDYLFSADTLDSLEIIGFKQSNPDGRGAFSVKNVKNVIIRDFEATGYSAETAYYKTDSALMLWDNERIYLDNINVHDHGFQYGTETEKLNRCITIQGDQTKAVVLRALNFQRVNQGLILSTPNAHVLYNDCYIENSRDNDLYLLGALSFLATNSTFNDYYDECVILNNGNYSFRGCRFMNVPNKVFGLAAGNTESLIVQGNDVVLPEGYSNNVVAFRDSNSVLDRFMFSGNNVIVNPATTNKNDIFQFGQINEFSIENNDIQISRMQDDQILFSFRNNDESQAINGVIANNKVRPYGSNPSISGTYRFIESSKQNITIDNRDNTTAGGRYRSDLKGLFTSGGNFFSRLGYNLDRHLRRELYNAEIPLKGYFNKGDIVYNTDPKNNIYAWVRVTDGDSNVDGVDWSTVKTITGSDNYSTYVATRSATFTDLSVVAKDMESYQGTWWFYQGELLNSPIKDYAIVEVVRGNTETVGYIRVTGINTQTSYMAIVNAGIGNWKQQV